MESRVGESGCDEGLSHIRECGSDRSCTQRMRRAIGLEGSCGSAEFAATDGVGKGGEEPVSLTNTKLSKKLVVFDLAALEEGEPPSPVSVVFPVGVWGDSGSGCPSCTSAKSSEISFSGRGEILKLSGTCRGNFVLIKIVSCSSDKFCSREIRSATRFFRPASH